jgi:uncharacterized protein YigA (DUF484 family)
MPIGHEPTDLERKSLEAHVDLCAQRYRFLESKLQALDEKVDEHGSVIRDVHDLVQKISEKRNDQLLNWSIGIGASLLAIIGYLLVTYVL